MRSSTRLSRQIVSALELRASPVLGRPLTEPPLLRHAMTRSRLRTRTRWLPDCNHEPNRNSNPDPNPNRDGKPSPDPNYHEENEESLEDRMHRLRP